jgi:hypothetical protein
MHFHDLRKKIFQNFRIREMTKTTSSSRTYLSALALVLIHSSIHIAFKISQVQGGGYAYSASGSLVVSELVKLCLSIAGMLRFDSAQELAVFWSYFSFKPDNLLPVSTSETDANVETKKGGIRLIASVFGLAGLYALNNNLTFFIYTMSDPATFSLLKSMSSFTTALAMYFLLSRPIYRAQWFAVLFQCAGLIVFQYDPCEGTPLYSVFVYLLLGVAISITTISSVWNDHTLKTSDLSLNGVNIFLYGFGALLNVLFFIRDRSLGGPGFFEGYTWQACLVVFFNSIIGIAISLVYKYGDALVKTFASSITAVLLMIVSTIFFGLQSNIVIWTGALITSIATYMFLSEKPPAATNAVEVPKLEPSGNNKFDARYFIVGLAGIVAGMVITYIQLLPAVGV